MSALLDRPLVWEASRVALDQAFGLYRRRRALLARWGLLAGSPSVLDVGCGIGQYAGLSAGEYLGVDLNCRYVEWARRRKGGPGRSFRCVDAAVLEDEGRRFDLVLMVDFLHHLNHEACVRVLGLAGRLATRDVVCLEPVTEQRNRIGRWFIEHDRGEHMRPHAELRRILADGGLEPAEDEELTLGPISTRAILCPR